jgi:hypothetical protein
MKKVLILVEGPTEETFVREVLAAYFEKQEVYITSTIVKTKRIPGKPDESGGGSDYGKIKRDLQRLLGDSSAHLVTTMFDFYALPKDFPDRLALPDKSCYERVQHLEQAFSQDVHHPKFLPYLALHEFEAMIFTSIEHMIKRFPSHNVGPKLRAIRNKFSSPEEIDNDLPPSKRILELIPEYEKPSDGVTIALSIGLDLIREQCPHFSQWISKIEQVLQ